MQANPSDGNDKQVMAQTSTRSSCNKHDGEQNPQKEESKDKSYLQNGNEKAMPSPLSTWSPANLTEAVPTFVNLFIYPLA